MDARLLYDLPRCPQFQGTFWKTWPNCSVIYYNITHFENPGNKKVYRQFAIYLSDINLPTQALDPCTVLRRLFCKWAVISSLMKTEVDVQF